MLFLKQFGIHLLKLPKHVSCSPVFPWHCNLPIPEESSLNFLLIISSSNLVCSQRLQFVPWVPLGVFTVPDSFSFASKGWYELELESSFWGQYPLV